MRLSLPSSSGLICGPSLLLKVEGRISQLGMDQYLLIPFLGGWTSIYQLFWGSLGTRVLTHPQLTFRTTSWVHSPMMSNRPPWSGSKAPILWPFKQWIGNDSEHLGTHPWSKTKGIHCWVCPTPQFFFIYFYIMIIVNIIINGLVLLGKSKPETIDIPIKSGAFRLKFSLTPSIDRFSYGFPMLFPWFSYVFLWSPVDPLWILGTQRARQLQAGAIFVAQGLTVRRCHRGAAGQPLRHCNGDVGMGSIWWYLVVISTHRIHVCYIW